VRRRVIAGSRGSKLALLQTDLVLERLRRALPDSEFALKTITAEGDRSREPLSRIGGRGVFVKELESALLARQIDLAVHSAKDLPGEMTAGLVLAAVPEREDPRDALVTRGRLPLAALPDGARMGTGSPRRAAQLLALRPDLRIEEIRGNVETRVRKGTQGDLDGVVLAAAGLHRLGMNDVIAAYLEPTVFLPAVGQAALAVQTRAGDEETLSVVRAINHEPSLQEVVAERSFLRALGGGCQTPLACLGRVSDGRLSLAGMVASADGQRVLRARVEGAADDAEALGRALAGDLLAQGARELLVD